MTEHRPDKLLEAQLKLLGVAVAGCQEVYGEMQPESGWTNYRLFDDKRRSATAIVFVIDTHVVLACKGSKEFYDWLLNLKAVFPRKYHGAKMHRGFCKQAEVIEDMVWEYVFKLMGQTGKPLLITGHSLGGADAEIIAYSLIAQKALIPEQIHLGTFGKPNVFRDPPKARMPGLSMQLSVIHGSDGVARIPALRHGPDLGQDMLYLGNNGLNYLLNMSTEAGDFKAWELINSDWNASDTGSDHKLGLYQGRIKRINQGVDAIIDFREPNKVQYWRMAA